ncbi:extracellular solute-binding protein [Flexivirga caeni]|nr:extracellular solute-binding protein [Flexivirga caeni]
MAKMEKVYERSHPSIDLSATTLSWGTPYYTKLALATAGGAPPDVGIVHLSRLDTFVEAGLLTPFPADELTAFGMPATNFTPRAAQKATVDGQLHAIPLDTHPFVMYYNIPVCRKAGLLDADDNLKPIHGPAELTAALLAAKKVTGHYGGVVAVIGDPATNLRYFSTLYYQAGGTYIADAGQKITIDNDKAAQVLTFMRNLTKSGLMPATINDAGVLSLFSTGKAGFLFDGEWDIPTYRATPLNGKFNVVPIPHIFGPKPVAYADSHSFVIPRNSAMDKNRRAMVLTFIKTMLENSLIWAGGGHVPAWTPVRDSAAFKALKPQANYVAAAETAMYDPPAWYSGAGSDFENIIGAAVANSQSGVSSASSAVGQMWSGLRPYADAKAPVG